jgi:hypothetical protein
MAQEIVIHIRRRKNMKFMKQQSQTWVGRRATLTLLVASAVGLSATALAEEGEQSLGDVSAALSTVFYTFPGRPIVAISQAGNVLRFEGPIGYDHVGVGAVGEGYVLCYNTVRAYDVGNSFSGFSTPTASCSGQKCTINRVTTDGKMRLTQVIEKPTDPGNRSLKITMELTNLSSQTVKNVVLRRQVDLDVDTGGSLGTGNFTNRFASTFDSAWGWNAPFDYPFNEVHAVMLSKLKVNPTSAFKTPRSRGIITADILDTSCAPPDIAQSGPVRGDFGASIQFNIQNMARNKSATAIVEYRRN